MGRVSDLGIGFKRSQVASHRAATQQNLDVFQADHDLNGLFDVKIWHAIANGINIHKTVGRHTPTEPACADRHFVHG